MTTNKKVQYAFLISFFVIREKFYLPNVFSKSISKFSWKEILFSLAFSATS